jgi:alcohol dehydrogenase class IV
MYCRTFQKTFRTALPVLPYRKPEILHDVKEIPHVLQEKTCGAVLLVTDQSIREHGLTERLENALSKAHISCSVFETVVNPTTDVIEKAVNLYRQDHCTALIGFGGGSSIDTAKAVGACIANPGRTLAQMSGILKVRRQLPPLFAVPTTAGTGSETTLAAVVTDSKTRHKYPVNDFP